MIDEDALSGQSHEIAAPRGRGRGRPPGKGQGTDGKRGPRRQGAAGAEPQAGSDPGPAAVLAKREFVARVAENCGVPRAQVRAVVEATLAELGRAIAAGETLALPPFGRARVNRQKTVKGSEVMILRLRRPGAGDGDGDGDADE